MMEDRAEKIKNYKELIKARASLRVQMDCIDVDMRELEREISNFPIEPRCW